MLLAIQKQCYSSHKTSIFQHNVMFIQLPLLFLCNYIQISANYKFHNVRDNLTKETIYRNLETHIQLQSSNTRILILECKDIFKNLTSHNLVLREWLLQNTFRRITGGRLSKKQDLSPIFCIEVINISNSRLQNVEYSRN